MYFCVFGKQVIGVAKPHENIQGTVQEAYNLRLAVQKGQKEQKQHEEAVGVRLEDVVFLEGEIAHLADHEQSCAEGDNG